MALPIINVFLELFKEDGSCPYPDHYIVTIMRHKSILEAHHLERTLKGEGEGQEEGQGEGEEEGQGEGQDETRIDFNRKIIVSVMLMINQEFDAGFYSKKREPDEDQVRIEREVIVQSLAILKKPEYKSGIISDINLALSVNIDPQFFDTFSCIYQGYHPRIDYTKVTDITEENIEEIYTNISFVETLYKIGGDRTRNMSSIMTHAKDYLFCLYYFDR